MMRATLLGLGLLMTSAALASCGQPGGAKAPAAAAAGKAGPITLVIQDHRFVPAEVVVPANTSVELEVTNRDPLAEEFDSSALKVEKVIAGGDTGTVRLRPLAPGRYPFIGEYHSETAQGVVVAR